MVQLFIYWNLSKLGRMVDGYYGVQEELIFHIKFLCIHQSSYPLFS